MCDGKSLVHINSRYRSGGAFSSFGITLDLPYNKANLAKITLKDCVIPQSGYTFDQYNNTITFNEGASDLTAVIPEGFYTSTEAVAAIKLAMDTAGTLTYTVTDNSLTSTITISATGAFVLKWSKRGSPAYRLGFNAEDTASAATHTSNFCYNFAPDNYLYLRLSNGPVCLTPFTQPVSCTFPIALYGGSETVSKYDSQLTVSVDESFLKDNYVQIDLYKEDGTPAGLHSDWAFTLAIEPN